MNPTNLLFWAYYYFDLSQILASVPHRDALVAVVWKEEIYTPAAHSKQRWLWAVFYPGKLRWYKLASTLPVRGAYQEEVKQLWQGTHCGIAWRSCAQHAVLFR